jgi:hypothetical protein
MRRREERGTMGLKLEGTYIPNPSFLIKFTSLNNNPRRFIKCLQAISKAKSFLNKEAQLCQMLSHP